MACPCCGLRSKLDTLEGSVVHMYSRKPEHSVMMSERVKATAEGRGLVGFDAKAQKKLSCSLPCKSRQGGLSTIRCMQQETFNNSSASRSNALRSKVSANPKQRERRTLAFILHDEGSLDDTNEYSSNLEAFPSKRVEMQPILHVSAPPYQGIIADNPTLKHEKLRVAKECANGKVSDLDDSDESEHEVNGAVCLSSFTFGPRNYLPPSLEVIASGKKSLVRKLSSESCISMLSLDCTDDRLSADERAESFVSGGLSLRADMAGFSGHLLEVRTNLDDEASIGKPCFQFRGSGSMGMHLEPNFEMERETVKSSGLDICRGTTKGQLETDLKFDTSKKKRSRPANYERHTLRSSKARKASLNLRECRGLTDPIGGGMDMDRAFNLGVGIGVSYMLFANWKELKKLNVLLERTESLVKDMQQQGRSRNSPLLGCYPNLESLESEVEASQAEGFGADGVCEPMLKHQNMADLEAALEAELALLQQNLEAEVQVTSGGSYERNINTRASNVEELPGKSDQGGTSFCLTNNGAVNIHHVVSPNTLNKRLHEVLEVQQEERIMHLEAQVEARELDLIVKEKELQCWKDIAHHLVNALPAKSAGRSEARTKDQGGFCLAANGSRAQQDLSSPKHDARHRPLPLKGEESQSTRRWNLDYELSARSNSFCESLNNNLIDPSFEALTLRNSLDWSVEVQSAEAEWRKEDSTLSSHDGQDVCDLLKDLEADKMFPWLLHEEEGVGEASHFGGELSPVYQHQLAKRFHQ